MSYTWPPTSACGVERWPVKTGTDASAGQIRLSPVVGTTVSALNAIPAPAQSSLPQAGRVATTDAAGNKVEFTVYRVHATLQAFKLEPDSDYHLALADSQGRTMVAEIPDPACVGKSSPLLPGIELARTQFDAKYTPTGSYQSVNVPVVVTGVGFFDFPHGQRNVADNAIELHPVLDIQFSG